VDRLPSGRYIAGILLNTLFLIVMGIFAYALIVIPMRHFPTFAGGAALGIMLIPIAVRTTTHTYVVPLPSERWTTTMSFAGRLTPGLAFTNSGSFHCG
jgi:hypothetical protein